MEIKNESQLRQVIQELNKSVVEDVLSKVYDELIKNIYEFVYKPGDGFRKVYAYGSGEPTYQFAQSWEKMVDSASNAVMGIIYQNYNIMTYDPEYAIHGDHYSGDMREELASILNEGTDFSIFGDGWWSQPRPYWDETISTIKSNIDKWIIDAYKKRGIVVK